MRYIDAVMILVSKAVKVLLAAGASTEAVSKDGNLPLHLAVFFTTEEEARLSVDNPRQADFVNMRANCMVSAMIQQGGADINSLGSKGGTSLWHAAGKIPAAKQLVGDLIAFGSNVRHQASTLAWTKGLHVHEKANGSDRITGQEVERYIKQYPFLDEFWTRQRQARCSALAKHMVWAVLLIGCRLGSNTYYEDDNCGDGGRDDDECVASSAAVALPYLPTEMWHRILGFIMRCDLHPRPTARAARQRLKREARAGKQRARQRALFTKGEEAAYAATVEVAKKNRLQMLKDANEGEHDM